MNDKQGSYIVVVNGDRIHVNFWKNATSGQIHATAINESEFQREQADKKWNTTRGPKRQHRIEYSVYNGLASELPSIYQKAA